MGSETVVSTIVIVLLCGIVVLIGIDRGLKNRTKLFAQRFIEDCSIMISEGHTFKLERKGETFDFVLFDKERPQAEQVVFNEEEWTTAGGTYFLQRPLESRFLKVVSEAGNRTVYVITRYVNPDDTKPVPVTFDGDLMTELFANIEAAIDKMAKTELAVFW